MSGDKETATVRVAQGLARGRRVASRAGGSYLSFQGLPYAKPPLGPLRFKPPQPAEPWTGVRDALKEGPVCSQVDLLLRLPYHGQEDCLYLNVYTKELPSPSAPVKLPVMVYIHGGAFVCGSGDTTLFGPDYLVEKDVVLVTINYRLGPMGFLSLPDASVPGNNGLKDQVAALRWVQENVAAFGGDPGNVTIFGESAGGASVQYHMLSPMSKGLFHKAIAQSGSVLNPWAFCTASQTRSRAFRLGEVLGCSTKDSRELLNFLRAASVQQLAEATTQVLTAEEMRGACMTPFLPVREDGKSDEDVFLPDAPHKLLQQGEICNVPFMTGLTSHEGIVFIEEFLKDVSKMKEVEEHFKDYLSQEVKSGDLQEISNKVKKFYFGGSRITKSHLPEYVNFMTDTWFLIGIQRALSLVAAKVTRPIFYYHFGFDGELNVYKKFVGASSLPGASHIDDLGYLFTMTFMDIVAKPESKTLKTLHRMVKMWTNFAKSGSPTAVLDEDVTVQWTPYTSKNPVFMDIDTELCMKENLMEDRYKLWNSLSSH